MSNSNLTNSRTAINLAKAFAGESQARNRYTFYAEVASEAGYPTLQDVFLQTAHEERGHAEKFFEYLMDGLGETALNPQVLVPVFIGDTAGNLLAAANGERMEWSSLYPAFGKIAMHEGFNEIATSFLSIASVEKRHDTRFRDLLRRIKTGALYTDPYPVTWQCSNCGFRHTGHSAPKICPACQHPQSFFSIAH